jgi:hypothetical protein
VSKVFLTLRNGPTPKVLEVPASKARNVLLEIKQRSPGISIGYYGAKDRKTFRRVHREFINIEIHSDIDEFLDKTPKLLK